MSGSLAGGDHAHFCPRLLDYIVIVGARNPNGNSAAQTPELLRRYPVEDHEDFPLPPDVVFFCQPEGCISAGVKRVSLREDNSFVFSLTEKDSNRVRFGMCVNFYRPFEKRNSTDHGGRGSAGEQPQTLQKPRTESIDGDDEGLEPQTHRRRRKQGRVRNNTLTSLCIVSHHPFFSTFRECLFILKRLIDACNQRTGGKKVGAAKGTFRNSVWGVLTGNRTDDKASLVTHDVRELETWICRLLSAPVCIPGKTRVEVSILPTEMQAPMTFALPDAHRFCLADFPMHLPLELLGVETCLKVLTCILLEHKIVLQSRDYNALSMSVMAFVAMIYPMEYMFPVIPLLPTCMSCAEQLLLVPSPYIIGVPASFFLYKADFKLPDDVWLIDLDSNKITVPRCADELPPLPEPEGTQLKNHLKQALSSMSMAPQPILNLDKVQEENLAVPVRNASPSTPEMGFNPLIYGNDVDSVDIATRVAMVKFFTSKNVLGDHWVHTRTLRLYPRPVVAFQLATFLKSRGKQTDFIKRLASTQAVEYFGEWCLAPTNTTFQRIQNTVHDPVLIGDKPKWYAHQLAAVQFNVYDDNSTLASALELALTDQVDDQSEPPTDESGSDTGSEVSEDDAGGSTTSVPEIEVDREALAHCSPPSTLQVPPMLQESPSPVTMSPHSTATTPSPDSEKQAINPMFHEEGDRGNDTDADIDSLNYDSDSSHPSKTDALEYIAKQAKGRPELETDNNNIPKSRPYGPSMSMYELPVHGDGTGRGAGLPSLVEKGDPQSTWSLASIASKISNLKIDQSDAESVSSATSSDRNGYTHSLQRSSSGVSTLSTRSRGSDGGKSFGPFPRAPSSRKALADKSLIRHSSSQSSLRRPPPPSKGSPQSPPDSSRINSSENQQFLKDVVSSVLEGQGVGWLQLKKLKRLMEQESLRMFVINRLLENAVRDEENSKEGRYSDHIEDVKVSRAVYKGMLAVLKACVVGLESSHDNHVPGGVASAFGVLEIAHTHYYTKEVPQLPKRKDDFDKDEDKGSRRRKNYDTRSLDEENMVAALGSDGFEVVEKPDGSTSGEDKESDRESIIEGAEGIDEDIKSAEDLLYIKQRRKMNKNNSVDSDTVSESSTLVSNSSETLANDSDYSTASNENLWPQRINHHSIRAAVSDSEIERTGGQMSPSRRAPTTTWHSKSTLSKGFRYRNGHLISTAGSTQDGIERHYIFEGLIGKERSALWENMQFWEDGFLDLVAQERELVGMDQAPADMIDRYKAMSAEDRKRLEEDEDKLLSTQLFNLVAYMVSMQVSKNECRRKIRRLLGKSHIGLLYSQDVMDVLDQINNLHGNDIDLKPYSSRYMRKQTFVVHAGTDTRGDLLFMEVCDDAIVLRTGNGQIQERWWYEKLINMTYCPKTKVLCLWRKKDNQTQLNKFYTKKCKELYFCVKDSMEKAAAKQNGKKPGPELGGEFPIQDMQTGEGGLLQVTLEGINLKFIHTQAFIELKDIRKCNTEKGVFVLEQFDSQTRQVTVRKYKSSMANEICYAVLCVFSYVAAAKSQEKRELEAKSPVK
ncbi:MAP kinase-activating death domain protein-like isoform X21 [Branchiostoma floridae x Branchiostoma japonicum]